jgi:hypothetical protein
MERQPLFSRVFISLLTSFSFVAMSLSGIAAFIVPQGKVAYWTSWTFLGLSKTQWSNIHITTSVLFLIAGIWHICYNWSHLMQYLRGIPDKVSARWRDLAVAALTTCFFTIGAVTKTPPLNYILDFNTWIKETWVKTPADDPPFGHAELLSLKGFCRKMHIDPTKALQELRQAGINVKDENVSLERMAADNGTTPSRLYEIIRKLEKEESAAVLPTPAVEAPAVPAPAPSAAKSVAGPAKCKTLPLTAAAAPARYTADLVVERFEGKGYGRKTMAAVCLELNLDSAIIKQKLEFKNLSVKDDETLKDAGERLGVAPIELLTTMLTGELIKK